MMPPVLIKISDVDTKPLVFEGLGGNKISICDYLCLKFKMKALLCHCLLITLRLIARITSSVQVFFIL